MGATPELKAVALLPIYPNFGVGFLFVWHLLARGLFDPLLRNQLLAVPLPFLQVKLPELGDVFRAELEAIAVLPLLCFLLFRMSCALSLGVDRLPTARNHEA